MPDAEQTVFLPRRATTRMMAGIGVALLVILTPLLVWTILTPDPAQVVGIPLFAALWLLGAFLLARGLLTQRNCRLELTPRGFTYVSPWGRHHRVAAASAHRVRVVLAATQDLSALAVGPMGGDILVSLLAGAAEGVTQGRGHRRQDLQVLEVLVTTDEGRVALPLESMEATLAYALVPALVRRGLRPDRIEVRRSRKRVVRA